MFTVTFECDQFDRNFRLFHKPKLEHNHANQPNQSQAQ